MKNNKKNNKLMGFTEYLLSLFMPKKPKTIAEPAAEIIIDNDDNEYKTDEENKIPYPYFPAPAPLHCQTIQQEIDVPLMLKSSASYKTDDGGTLAISPGAHKIRIGMRVLYNAPATDDLPMDTIHEFPIDTIAVTHKIIDNKGHEWQADIAASSDLLSTVFIERLEQLDAGEKVIMHREETAPKQWREIITQSALLAGIRDLMDDRSYYYATVDNQLLILQAKYQTPHYDIGWLSPESIFLIRVTELCDNMHADVDTGNQDMPTLPPLYFTMTPAELLLQTTESYKDADGTRHDEDDPFIITFHPTGQLAQANPGVAVSRNTKR